MEEVGGGDPIVENTITTLSPYSPLDNIFVTAQMQQRVNDQENY